LTQVRHADAGLLLHRPATVLSTTPIEAVGTPLCRSPAGLHPLMKAYSLEFPAAGVADASDMTVSTPMSYRLLDVTL
jgi:hypothetical protein